MATHRLAHRPRIYYEGTIDLPRIDSRRVASSGFTVPGAKPDMFFIARLEDEPVEGILCLSAGCQDDNFVNVRFFNANTNAVNLGSRAITIIAL